MQDSAHPSSEQIEASFKTAVADAVRTTLQAGVSIFSRDQTSGIDVMEQPDGCRFEIRYIPNASGDSNHQVIRELSSRAA